MNDIRLWVQYDLLQDASFPLSLGEWSDFVSATYQMVFYLYPFAISSLAFPVAAGVTVDEVGVSTALSADAPVVDSTALCALAAS